MNTAGCSPANIFLVGFMATGKSVVGRILSERLNLPFVDADKEIEGRAGKSIPDIFRDEGEAAFRRLEASVIQELCSKSGGVVAAGGGAFVAEENRRLMLASGRVFCLTAQPGTILERLKTGSKGAVRKEGYPGSGRPMLAGEDTFQRIAQLMDQRAPYYAQAHNSVTTDGLTTVQVAQQILDICAALPGVPEERK